jgi:hypothetical protein
MLILLKMLLDGVITHRAHLIILPIYVRGAILAVQISSRFLILKSGLVNGYLVKLLDKHVLVVLVLNRGVTILINQMVIWHSRPVNIVSFLKRSVGPLPLLIMVSLWDVDVKVTK